MPSRLALNGRAVRNALADNHASTITGATLRLELGAPEYIVLVPE